MSTSTETLYLKWGTFKGYDNLIEGGPMEIALKKYFDVPNHSMSAMLQKDTDEQQQYLLEAIDGCQGEIWNSWLGEVMSKEEAKKYILEYGT